MEKVKFDIKGLFRTFWNSEQQDIPEIDAILNSDELSDEEKKEMRASLKEIEKLERATTINKPEKQTKRGIISSVKEKGVTIKEQQPNTIDSKVQDFSDREI